MDDIVKQALAKWPDVPDCYGWLALDARGNWYLRDDEVQAQGPFSGGTLHAKGEQLWHEKLIDFIGRNYEHDAQGQWFFQNGPQRVYVELEVTPLIWRLDNDFSVHDHVGRAAIAQRCLIDDCGFVYLQCDSGFGLVHTMDTGIAAQALEQGLWLPEEVSGAALPALFSYVKSPHAGQQKVGH